MLARPQDDVNERLSCRLLRAGASFVGSEWAGRRKGMGTPAAHVQGRFEFGRAGAWVHASAVMTGKGGGWVRGYRFPAGLYAS